MKKYTLCLFACLTTAPITFGMERQNNFVSIPNGLNIRSLYENTNDFSPYFKNSLSFQEIKALPVFRLFFVERALNEIRTDLGRNCQPFYECLVRIKQIQPFDEQQENRALEQYLAQFVNDSRKMRVRIIFKTFFDNFKKSREQFFITLGNDSMIQNNYMLPGQHNF